LRIGDIPSIQLDVVDCPALSCGDTPDLHFWQHTGPHFCKVYSVGTVHAHDVVVEQLPPHALGHPSERREQG
jgi:hypothetical protein